MSRSWIRCCPGLVAGLAALLVLAPMAEIAAAAQGPGQINIRVLGEDEEPVEDAEVIVRDAVTGEILTELATDSAGLTQATELEFAQYHLVARKGGCEATSPLFEVSEANPTGEVVFVLDCDRIWPWFLLGLAAIPVGFVVADTP